ncbi:hypothetical protein LINPERHAP2_LOCUS14247 [Linum perenne]
MTKDLCRYLGVQVLHARVTAETYQSILDRMDLKLSSWKAKSLALATLAQSVLMAIPAHAIQTSVLPTTTCESIDRRISYLGDYGRRKDDPSDFLGENL